jgi:hypothetical protein
MFQGLVLTEAGTTSIFGLSVSVGIHLMEMSAFFAFYGSPGS